MVTGDQNDCKIRRNSVYDAPLRQNAAAAPRIFSLYFGVSVLLPPWSYSVFSYCCSVQPATSPGGHNTSCFFLHYIFYNFFQLFRFSLCQRIWIATICMPYPSYPIQRHVFALSTLLTTLVCSISVSWFCDHRTCISVGGKNRTDTGCAACRPVERTV